MNFTFYRIITVFVFSIIVSHSSAQWNLNPTNPQLVCAATEVQKNISAFADGNGGVFVFWLDNRSGNYDVYGQHYDGNGIKKWEADGRIFVNLSGNVQDYAITKFQNHLYIGWITNNNDSCLYRKFDLNGTPQWSSPVLAFYKDGSEIGGIYMVTLVANPDGILCAARYNTFGYVRIRLNHIAPDGTLTGPQNGVMVGPIQIGSFKFITDHHKGAYVYWSSSNGAGASLNCIRINQNLQNLWNNTIVPTQGSNGLSYDFQAVSDPGGVYFLWESNNDVLVSRYDTSGTALWSPSIVNACNSPHTENSFHAVNGNQESIFISWLDNRPPGNKQVYAQHIDKNGNQLWSDDGVEVFKKNYYLPYPRMAATDSGSVAVACYFNDGFWVDKLNADSSKAWTDSLQVCEFGKNPNDKDYTLLRSDSNLVAVWGTYESAAYNLYIAKVGSIDTIPNTTVSIQSTSFNQRDITLFPNPGVEKLHLQGVANEAQITITDVLGREVHNMQSSSIHTTIDTRQWPSGTYFIRISNPNLTEYISRIWIKSN